MNIKTKMVGKTLVVGLSGEFDLVAVEEFRKTVDGYLESGKVSNLLLDMSKVSFMDSSGLGAILGRYKLVSQMGGNMAIAGARSQVIRVLELSGIMKIIDIFGDVNSALAELS